jgi:hypothetical protein
MKWSAPTKEQGQTLALTAQVELLKSAKQLTKKVPNESTTKKPKTARKDNKWKNTLPKAGNPTTKEFKGKQYQVNCPYHPNQWVCHSSQECSKNPKGSDAATFSGDAGSATKSQKLKASCEACSGPPHRGKRVR